MAEVLQNNENIKLTYTNSNIFIKQALEYLPEEAKLMDTIYNFYTQLIIQYPMLKKGNSYNTNTETAFIWNRERMHGNLRLSKELTPDVIEEISSILGFSNEYQEIWAKHQVLLFDNSKLSDAQLKFTLDILNRIPSEINDLGGIAFSGYLGSGYFGDADPCFGDIDPPSQKMVQRTDSMTILHLFS